MNKRNFKNQLNFDKLKSLDSDDQKEYSKIMNFQNSIKNTKENKKRIKNRAKNKAKRKMQQKQRGNK